MDLHNSKAYTRRVFLQQGAALASAAVTIPTFLQGAAEALAQTPGVHGSRPGVPDERILVVVQLAGGNDGLNTVIPYGDASYYRARPGIGIREEGLIKLGSSRTERGLGLHPRMGGLKSLYDDGMLSIVQGVGYPNPNRSHFKSTDIWHTADEGGTGDGWLGRFFDNKCAGQQGAGCSGHEAIAIGRTAPLAMQGRTSRPIAFESEDLFRWTGLEDSDSLVHEAYEQMTSEQPSNAAPGSAASFLTRTALDAQIASDRIRDAVGVRPLVQYPRSRLGQQLAMVASMIRAGLETRVYYVTLGGFDTHARQGNVNGSHANLLAQFSQGVKAFWDDLKAQNNDGRVLMMSFSEFGRRVAQNGSGGTDHGAAAPMFLMGPNVRPGVVGDHPSLTDLDGGDLKHTVDFRSVYSGVLEDWLKTDGAGVLGRGYRPAKVVRI